MTGTTDQDFIDALNCWPKSPDHLDFSRWLRKHWIRAAPTVLHHVRQQGGRLGEEAFGFLNEVRETISGDPNFARKRAGEFLTPLQIHGEESAYQFATLTSAMLAGVAAAHHLSGWQPGTNRSLAQEAIEPLTACLQQYHKAWNLYTPPVRSIFEHAAATSTGDRATAALDSLHVTFAGDEPVWWTQSNWLLVRRLLSFLLGDDEGTAVGHENNPEMLLVIGNSQRRYRGLTAPVTTGLYAEGWSSAYLDPVALGVTVLDESMLNSLRIAARICRPDLVNHSAAQTSQPLALRIAPQPGKSGLVLLRGGSAGGLVTVAACATARGKRLDRRCTASFQVTVSDVSLLQNVSRDLPRDKVELWAVDPESIEAKLTSRDFKDAGLKTAFLHRTQTSKPGSRERGWSEWVPRLEQEHDVHDVRILPIEAEHTLDHVIEAMTGDERLEQVVLAFAAEACNDWPAMRAGEALGVEENHRLDTHVEPRLSVELWDAELRERRSQRAAAEHPQDDEGRGGGIGEYRFEELDPGLDDLVERYVRGENSWILITDKAGGGKTVLSWQLRHVLSSGPEPCLVVRYEDNWPDDLRTDLEAAVGRCCPNGIEPREVITYLAERQRIIVIFDALDQVSDAMAGLLTRLYRRNTDPELAAPNLRVIVTSRPHAVNSWPDAFHREHWRHFRLEPFDEHQQEQYLTRFADLREWHRPGDGQRVRDLWETVTALQTDTDLLSLPINLRHIRAMIEDHLDLGTPLRQFRTAGDLPWETAWRGLSRDPFKGPHQRREPGVVTKLMRAAACLAFEMLRQAGSHEVRRGRQIEQIRQKAAERFGGTSGEWEQCDELLRKTVTTGNAVLRANNPDELSFPSLKSLEFFAGLFLAGYADQAAREDLRPHIGDDRWSEAWKFAIEMPETTDADGESLQDPVVYRESMKLLFAPPAAPHPRPTELMFRAWQVMKRNDFQGLPGILRSYRQQFRDILAGEDLQRARQAAELLWEEDVKELVAENQTGRWSFEDLRPDAGEYPAYALCSDKRSGCADQLTFIMGASPEDNHAYDNEKLRQPVTIPAFRVATCCVTRNQYLLFDPLREQQHLEGDYGINQMALDGDCPMTYVSWYDAFCFGLWLGNAYRLPTEVQWEGAAWGGMDRKRHPEYLIGVPPYDGGFTSEQVNFDGNHPLEGTAESGFLGRTLPVRWDEGRREQGLAGVTMAAVPSAYQPNGFGLWHMSGNVFEWCQSEWCEEFVKLITNSDPQIECESAGVSRSLRGGTWYLDAELTRCSYRLGDVAAMRGYDTGFRLVRTL